MLRRLLSSLELKLSHSNNMARDTRFNRRAAPFLQLLCTESTCFQHQITQRGFKTSQTNYDLMDFFDDKKNWGETSIRTGRPWKLDELRIKSNSDLHKLWFILLKERNMLLTMEAESKRECQLFPNPERVDKVEDSLKNLETVVRERNRAFSRLETGTTGERPGSEEENFLGLEEYRQHDEYSVPKSQNKPYLLAKKDEPQPTQKEKFWFITRWRRKQLYEQRRDLRRHQYEVIQLLQKFPDLDVDALKDKYPDVNVDAYIDRFWNNKVQGNRKSNH
ncbi:unnamed protein product [Orchesella dallaii]|uniref:Large ribosomal subunit protein uL29m n=1 Tax=Orchesella dallaii TaxID=48710 RepID=A0ABP1S4Y7_9HEXA